MVVAKKRSGVQVEIALFGVIPKQAPLGKYAISQVNDLADVIHQLESRHSFLRKIKYQVTVNDVWTNRNQNLYSGDKIVIQPNE